MRSSDSTWKECSRYSRPSATIVMGPINKRAVTASTSDRALKGGESGNAAIKPFDPSSHLVRLILLPPTTTTSCRRPEEGAHDGRNCSHSGVDQERGRFASGPPATVRDSKGQGRRRGGKSNRRYGRVQLCASSAPTCLRLPNCQRSGRDAGLLLSRARLSEASSGIAAPSFRDPTPHSLLSKQSRASPLGLLRPPGRNPPQLNLVSFSLQFRPHVPGILSSIWTSLRRR